jgi:hypothetical protein
MGILTAPRQPFTRQRPFFDRLTRECAQLPHEPNVLKRARRRHALAVRVLGDMSDGLDAHCVRSLVKQGNDETKAISDKPHGSSHLLSLVPGNEHAFDVFKPR